MENGPLVPPCGEITALIMASQNGERAARDQLFSLIYCELEKLARKQLACAPQMTLIDAPALIHEVFLRMARSAPVASANRHMFYGYAASVMRSVVIDYLRQRASAKRGDGHSALNLQTREQGRLLGAPDLEKLDDALNDLSRIDDRCRQVVEMRFFAGLGMAEIATVMGVSKSTVERAWDRARAYLYLALQEH